MSTTTSDLATQVACANTLDPALLERVRHEVLTVPDGWVSGYSRFQSGGWGTLSLLNDTGQAQDVTIGDTTTPQPTDLLERMPTTRALLDELGLEYMWARLALLEGGSYLWEHRDYQEDELAAAERHRVHIPIATASSAFLVLGGSAVHLAPGRIWRLTPTFVHGACNAHGPARIHLILDCYAGPALEALREGEHLPADYVRELPAADYAAFTAAHDALIATSLNQLLPAWPDTIVPDLGGLGFVHLLVHRHMLYQLDLYLAPASRVEAITSATRGRVMYTDPDHTPTPPGSHAQVEAFINAHRQAPPACTDLLVEVLVLTWLIRKRIVRGQQFMAYKEAHQLTTAARSLARTALSPDTAYLGWYHLETDLGATPIGRDCLRALAELAAAPAVPTLASLERALDTVLALADKAAPEAVEQLGRAIDAYRHYLDLG